ncbi:MAG: EpsG family protein [Empedobacter falsenii]
MKNDFYYIKILLYILVSFLAFLKLISKKNFKNIELLFIIIFCFIYSLFFGLRDISIGQDTRAYIRNFNNINNGALSYESASDTILYLLSKVSYYIGFNDSSILLILAFLYLTNLGLFCFKVGQEKTIFLFFSLISFFFFYNLGINILRQGLAVSFFLCGYAFYDNFKKRNLFFILTILSHISSVILLTTFYFSKYIKTKYTIIIFFTSIILSFLKFDLKFVIGYIPFFEKFLKYTDEESYIIDLYKIGFRLDFVIFNLLFLIIGLCIKRFILLDNYLYNNLFKTYALMSSIFFLCFNIPFSDRMGIYSWCLIPLIVFPIFKYKFNNMLFFRVLTFFLLICCFFLIL